MPRKKSSIDPDLAFFGNPYYTGKPSEGPLPVETHYASVYWKDLNPAFLAQECIRRGAWEGAYTILNRVQWMERDGDGWLISCYLGPPVDVEFSDSHLMDKVVGWLEFRVTDAEVEAGKMAEVSDVVPQEAA